MQSFDNWLVSVPLKQLNELVQTASSMEEAKLKNEAMQREIEG